jgi:hypothetical protein
MDYGIFVCVKIKKQTTLLQLQLFLGKSLDFIKLISTVQIERELSKSQPTTSKKS